MISAFAYMGQPKRLKTDNGPAYTSKGFKHFCQTFKISHSTGIPYNPQGQAIVERAHQTLKNQIQKLQANEEKYFSPHHILNHALFVINYLNLNEQGVAAMSRHQGSGIPNIHPMVKWKDVLTGNWQGPDPLITSGRGFA